MSEDFSTDRQTRIMANQDLSFLYNFVYECPNPTIAEAMKVLVKHWLANKEDLPELASLSELREKLTNEELIEISWLLAINPNTPPSVLEELCSDAPSALLERIAENSRTGYSTLAKLSYQAVAEIRIATAGNPRTPIASIMLLIEDENADVRYSMAENHSLPVEALKVLTQDDNPFVKFRAEKTLHRLSEQKTP